MKEPMGGAVFTAIRHLLGISNHELAELLPPSRDGRVISTRTLRDWAAGTEKIPPRIAERMWELLDLHTQMLKDLPPEGFVIPRRHPGHRDGLPHSWWIGIAARSLDRNQHSNIQWDGHPTKFQRTPKM